MRTQTECQCCASLPISHPIIFVINISSRQRKTCSRHYRASPYKFWIYYLCCLLALFNDLILKCKSFRNCFSKNDAQIKKSWRHFYLNYFEIIVYTISVVTSICLYLSVKCAHKWRLKVNSSPNLKKNFQLSKGSISLLDVFLCLLFEIVYTLRGLLVIKSQFIP